MPLSLAVTETQPRAANALPRWSPNGRAIAVVSARSTLTVWDASLHQKLKEHKPLADEIRVRRQPRSEDAARRRLTQRATQNGSDTHRSTLSGRPTASSSFAGTMEPTP